MYAVLPLIILGPLAGILAWVFYGFPEFVSLAYGLTAFCQSVLVRCIAYLDIFKFVLAFLGVSFIAYGLARGLLKGLSGVIKSNNEIKRLPVYSKGGAVILIKDTEIKAAFTHGLFRPRIYFSLGLINNLDRAELRAVFLHELHHMRRYDPLRFFFLTVLKDSFFYLPALSDFIDIIRAKKEHEADDAAIKRTKEPLSLAGALLKAAVFTNGLSAATVSIAGGGPSPLEIRIRRIIEGKEFKFKLPSMKTAAVSIFMTALLGLTLALPINAAVERCSMNHCAVHLDKLGQECKTHCDMPKHHKH